MRSRLIVAAICIPVLLVILLALPLIALPIFIAIISVIAVYELLAATGMMKHRRVFLYALVFAACVPFWAYYGTNGAVGAIGMFLYLLLLFIEALLDHKRMSFEKLAATAFCSFFIPYLFSSFVRIGIMPLGRYYILLPLIIAFISDAGGLFVGMTFGRHKLAPEISPKKSIEGAVGGLVAAIVGTLIYGLVIMLFFDFSVSFPLLIVYGLFGSVVSQIGDLSFSYIKRQFGIKDYGHILGGHGGILDRFDSVAFCAPFVEMMLVLAPALTLVIKI